MSIIIDFEILTAKIVYFVNCIDFLLLQIRPTYIKHNKKISDPNKRKLKRQCFIFRTFYLFKKHLRPYTNVRLLFAGKHNSTGNTSSDLRTWLSAALANQDTCIDGFDGTNGMVKGLVSTGIGQVMSLLQQLLTQVCYLFL